MHLGKHMHTHNTKSGKKIELTYGGGILPNRAVRNPTPHEGGFTINANHDEQIIGHINVVADPKMNGDHFVDMVHVNDDYRGEGVASALYQTAEKHIGKFVKPSKFQLPDGKAFWRNRHAKFGALKDVKNESVSRPLLKNILSEEPNE